MESYLINNEKSESYDEYFKRIQSEIEKTNDEKRLNDISRALSMESMKYLNNTRIEDNDITKKFKELLDLAQTKNKKSEQVSSDNGEAVFYDGLNTNLKSTHSVQESTQVEPKKQMGKINSEKGIKLLKKFADLCGKVEKENSPLKRQLLAIRIRSLKSRVEKEIEIQTTKKEQASKRSKLEEKTSKRKKEREKKIGAETKNIKNLSKQIASQEEYDYESENFLFDDKTVDSYGGIDGLIDAYKNSGDNELMEIANNIENARQAREELKKSRKKLAEARQEDIDKSHKKEEKTINKEEKRLIKQKKGSIFERISNFFKNVGQGIKDYFAEKKVVKEEAKKIYEQNAKTSAQNMRQKMMDDLSVNIDDWSTKTPGEVSHDAPEQNTDVPEPEEK